ncbi:translation initiation factor IF-2-like isoform X2 [Elephas maximus indicus]|uniref:translation initiation factor IF-2-like isoform X2 n=1 Tax=Elephas maximus indicus TaxID=99487 RepID=UPI002115E237|nr:translation initiation factor IF-2-like isoform X2 [Elephas maximus indicus]
MWAGPPAARYPATLPPPHPATLPPPHPATLISWFQTRNRATFPARTRPISARGGRAAQDRRGPSGTGLGRASSPALPGYRAPAGIRTPLPHRPGARRWRPGPEAAVSVSVGPPGGYRYRHRRRAGGVLAHLWPRPVSCSAGTGSPGAGGDT